MNNRKGLISALCQYELSDDDDSSSEEDVGAATTSQSKQQHQPDESDGDLDYRDELLDVALEKQHGERQSNSSKLTEGKNDQESTSKKRRIEDSPTKSREDYDYDSREDRRRKSNRRDTERYSPSRSDRHDDRRNRNESFRYDNRNARQEDNRKHASDDRPRQSTRSRMIDSFLRENREKTSPGAEHDARHSSGSSSRSYHDDGSRSRRGDRRRHGDRDDRSEPLTGVSASTFQKAGANSSSKIAEQIQKRKLLWQGAKEKKVSSGWESMLAACTDDKQAEKLKKMIGLRDEEASTSRPANASSTETPMRQDEVFRNLHEQYEVARLSTHTHRGMGIGFTSQFYALPQQTAFQADAEIAARTQT